MWSGIGTAVWLLAAARLGLAQGPNQPTYSNTSSSGDNLVTSPPFYPSPWGSGSGDWAEAYAKARDFVSQLTLLEKVNITTGVGWLEEACVGAVGSVPRLGFRSLCMQDSPVGIRFADYVSAFPGGVNIAATFDRGAMYARGYAMGTEHRKKGVDVQLGPVAGPLGRAPEGGRNWEGFSPDPVLTGIGIANTIQGIQDAGVIACAKHFIVNEQEHFRQVGEAKGYGFNITEALSSNVDDVTMHELYLWPFADAVRAGVGAVMCSYNQINNSYGCSNSYTMNYLLKSELDFQGFIMSDWQAHKSGVGDALAGLDMSMPGDVLFDTGTSFWGSNLTLAVVNGTIPEWRLDDMVTRIIAAWYKVGRDKTQVPVNFNSWSKDTYGYLHPAVGYGYGVINEHVDVREGHGSLIRYLGSKSTVLLKNVNGTLPLTGKEKLTAVFGDDAGDNPYGPNGCGDHGCDNGTLAMGWGSGTADYPYLISPLTAIQNEVASNYGSIQSVTDNYAYTQIQALAKQASVALVFVNADSGEGYINIDGNEGDRKNLTLWQGGDDLIQNVTAWCNNTIVVLHTVGPVLIESFVDNPNVTAILWAGLPGQESGNSIADVLYGRFNPGAKLPFTLGRNREDYGTDLMYEPNNGVDAPQQDFTEGVFIDYRAFDKAGIDPIFEFGFGLSYTTFNYSDLTVTKANAGGYTPASGQSAAAPVLGNYSTNLSDYLFPSDIDRVPLYIYPYVNSTNASASYGWNDYGNQGTSYIPPGAQDGSPQPIVPAGGAPGGNPGLYDVLYSVEATITNTGTVAGEEVPQLYVSLGGPNDPKVVLRGFERLSIQPGQSTTFHADLLRRDLSNWDSASQNWVITNYTKTVYVGSSSRKLPLSQTL
ncbi:glycoside hydrolase family 3 protein [Xylona heveae TC161]|uniref:beta-glucosidase n=1 Tax=Xylona heveae (strain CBS 132557 / TC161) TaxID=1328760 RepID=A0A165HHS2_XYLHT|nr:glycoside hydrolase family 3 protein [Xylona heveae TC161]KZF23538.1 glycoside hydrolase family 3 protein [Xylona heveae TC161]